MPDATLFALGSPAYSDPRLLPEANLGLETLGGKHNSRNNLDVAKILWLQTAKASKALWFGSIS